MSENFTIFPKPDGILIIAKGELKGVALSPTLRGMEGESPVDTTMAFCHYLETMLGKVDEFGSPLFLLNPASKVLMNNRKAPVIGETWTFGADDNKVISKITRRASKRNEMGYDFFSEAKSHPEYPVCWLPENQMEGSKFLEAMANKKYLPMTGEFLLTVQIGDLKEGKDARYAESHYLDFVSITRK